MIDSSRIFGYSDNSITGSGEVTSPHLDLFARMPVPLRRTFKLGVEKVVARNRAATGVELRCLLDGGGEWLPPFKTLPTASADPLPEMIVTTMGPDVAAPSLWSQYAPLISRNHSSIEYHPACKKCGLADPSGTFATFAVVPFVFLVDESRLGYRPAPRTWADLLEPIWSEDIVFGGWRPNDRTPYQDYNNYLLVHIYKQFGETGIQAFAANTKLLQHNVVIAAQGGSDHPSAGTISILPWMQAELCPRRSRTRVIWPEDGALAMPIGYFIKPEARERLAPLIEFVEGPELGAILARDCYPPTRAGTPDAFPPGALLQWPGWNFVRQGGLAAASRLAASRFFAAWAEMQEALA